ncbi:MAG: 2-methylcitrate synthase [Rickettsiales bacterium]|nr:2-methylcitrate synthase [Rickettsiales bacterium]
MVEVRKGLEGVIVDETSISKIDKEKNILLYRGYPVQELAMKRSFEHVAYMLWYQELPTDRELIVFHDKERHQRTISPKIKELIASTPVDAHPMSVLRTAVSYLGMEEPSAGRLSSNIAIQKSITLYSKLPTIVAAIARHRQSKPFIEPRDDLGFSENFFYMVFGEVPAPEIVKAFDISMTLYAEHTLNASTFSAILTASTLSDFYSCIVSAIGTLKGSLHGGANEEVMHMMKEIDDPAKAKDWMLDKIANKEKVMGFGHRVYKNGDSRVPCMTDAYKLVSEAVGDDKWFKMSEILAETMISEKGIHPNLDFPVGPTYYLMGFEIPIFTPIFVMSRITGWSAHVIEQWENNRIIRPSSAYVGHGERHIED